jgi:starvation-inducible DNA-binding protein
MPQWNNFAVLAAVEEKDRPLAEELKVLLADATIFYHTVHGFHWNVKGPDFAQYHTLFDQIVDDVYNSLDPIAENIMKLGGEAPFNLRYLLSISNLTEVTLDSTMPSILVNILITKNKELLETLKKTFDMANKVNEQGIANFIAERIDKHQKWNWFLEASVGK